MDRTIGTVILAVAGAALTPTAGEAQQISSPYRYVETGQEAGVFAGPLHPGAGRFELGPDAGTVVGLRYAIEVSGPFSLEGVVRAFSSTRDVRDPTKAEGERDVGTADVLLTSLEGRAKFNLTGRRTWHGLSPFLLAGGGVAWDMAGASESDENVLPEDRFEFGVSFLGFLGLGLRWLPTRHLQLRADGGFDLWQLDTPAGYQDPTRGLDFENPPPESEWVRGLEATLGIAIRW